MTGIEALLIGLAVGVVVGALGAGGGILSVPVLVYLLHQEPHAATMSSLVIVVLTALVSLPHRARSGQVDWRQGTLFGVLSVAGAYAGSRLSALVAPRVLMLLFAGLLLIVAVAMVRDGVRACRGEAAAAGPAGAEATALAEDDAGATAAEPRGGARWVRLILAATATGLLTGFFGVGGGFIVVPILVLAFALPMRRAAGTSLVIMIIAGAAGLLSRVGSGIALDWVTTLLFTAGSMVGGLAGGPLSARVRSSTLTLLFAALLLVVGLASGAATLLGG